MSFDRLSRLFLDFGWADSELKFCVIFSSPGKIGQIVKFQVNPIQVRDINISTKVPAGVVP